MHPTAVTLIGQTGFNGYMVLQCHFENFSMFCAIMLSVPSHSGCFWVKGTRLTSFDAGPESDSTANGHCMLNVGAQGESLVSGAGK